MTAEQAQPYICARSASVLSGSSISVTAFSQQHQQMQRLHTFADDMEVDVDVRRHRAAGAAAVEVVDAWLQLRLPVKTAKLMSGWQHVNM